MTARDLQRENGYRIRNVREITQPLFAVFGFFEVSENQVKNLLKGLFDADREGI